MTMGGHDTTLKRIREALEQEHDVILATVFGSVASGQAHSGSDLDVAVLADRPLAADRRYKLIERLADVIGRPVDLVDLRTAGVIVTREALHGQRLFCRDEKAYAGLLSRMVTDAEDFLPYQRRLLRARRNAWIR